MSLKHLIMIAALALPVPAFAQSPAMMTARNLSTQPLQGCANLIGTTKPSGFYWVTFSADTQAMMYCDNDVTYRGVKGGWTLVWSNLRGGKGKLTSDMSWGMSIGTLPRYRGAAVLNAGADRQSFEVYTGLKWWKPLMGRKEMMYEWAHDFGDERQIDQRAACTFDLNAVDHWMITFNQANCAADPGSKMPGLFTYSSGRRWSTADADNDDYTGACGKTYTGSPWWYGGCWTGSISGGGEDNGDGHFNGAYWVESDPRWGSADGTGAGNGWIYIR